MKQSWLRVGMILRPQGIKGEVKIQPLTDDPERFWELSSVWLETEDRREVKIQVNRVEPNAVYAFLEGCHSREGAEPLRHVYLSLPREQAVKLPENSWFVCELEGMDVYVDGKPLGTLCEVIQTGGVDVYAVEKTGGGKLYFPALRRIIQTVDIENRRMDLIGETLSEVAVDDH